MRAAATEPAVALAPTSRHEGLLRHPAPRGQAYAEAAHAHPFITDHVPHDAGYDDSCWRATSVFHSLCMHHCLPFTASPRGYLPGERISACPKLAP